MDLDDFKKDKFLKVLGAHIAKTRRARAYSQDRVCLEAGLSRGALSKIERGLVEPRLSTLAIIALTISVPLWKLLDIEID